jgi:hypothetical protein
LGNALPLNAQWVLLVAQVAAALFLAWYVVETVRLRRAAENQSRTLAQPILASATWGSIQIAPGDSAVEFFNIGRGPAYSFESEEKSHTFPTSIGSPPTDPLRFWVRLEPIPYIGAGPSPLRSRWQYRTEENAAGEWIDVTHRDRFNLGGIPNLWVFPLTVRYRDIVGRRYEQRLRVEVRGGVWIANFDPPTDPIGG